MFKVNVYIIFISIMALSQIVAQEGWKPQILIDSKTYLPDYSYAGYKWSEEIIPELPNSVSILDYGAKPDDEVDDTPFIIKAIEAESLKAEKEVRVIFFPKGKYLISEIIYINHSNLVLRGEGNETVLYVSKPLAEMKLTEEFLKKRDYMVKNNKKVGSIYFSIFSWSGGVITTNSLSEIDKKEVVKEAEGKRGSFQLKASAIDGVKPGDTLALSWNHSDDEMVKHIYGDAKIEFGDRLKTVGVSLARQYVSVVSVKNNTIVIKEPLLHDVLITWNISILKKDFLENVGIENFHMKFVKRKFVGHHLEAGFNAFHLIDLKHSWLKNVRITNSDSAVLIDKCANITLDDVETSGREGHYSVKIGSSSYVLVKNFKFNANAIHNPSFNTYCSSSVYTKGFVKDAKLDQHNGCNQSNLMDCLEIENGENLFSHGGAEYFRPTAGSFNTFWNIAIKKKIPKPLECKDAPNSRIIGLYCNSGDLKLNYKPKPHVEGLNKKGIQVKSLFEYQLEERLNRNLP